ncbi:MAG: peptide-methionine (R)-S-oxide reductase MsrB [Janthinobacterium lividum]
MVLDRRSILTLGSVFAATASWFGFGQKTLAAEGNFAVTKSDEEWQSSLGAPAYDVLRREGTERPYSSPLNREHRAGRFACAGCDTALFSSSTKFDSHTGWPSFWRPLDGAVGESRDRTLGMARTEIHCATCSGHLGHVFNDGPRPTGLRYCMNGVAMRFTAGEA